MNKISFWLSIVAFAASLLMIILWICNNFTFAVASLDNFIGVSVSLLTVVVTLVLGWQIYNAIEIKEKICRVEALETTLKQQENQMEQMFYNTSHHQSYLSAIVSIQNKDFANGYRFLLDSLCNSLLLKSPINVEILLQEMRKCANQIPQHSVLEDDIIAEVNYNHETILQSSIFDCIKESYMSSYAEFQRKVQAINR